MVKSPLGRDFWSLGWTLYQWHEVLASNSLRATKHKSPLGIWMYLWLIHIVGWQEPTQNCKAIFQLKNKRKFKKNPLVDLGFLMHFAWTQGPWNLGCVALWAHGKGSPMLGILNSLDFIIFILISVPGNSMFIVESEVGRAQSWTEL